MRYALTLAMVPFLVAADTETAAMAVNSDCVNYAGTHTLVRDDVLAQLQVDRTNLEVAESALSKAQKDLTAAKEQLIQAKKDLEALHTAAIQQRAIIAEYKAQKAVLEGHITKLELATCPDPTAADQIVESWEAVDGVVGIGFGYVLGTGTCLGMAYAFNTDALNR